MKNEYLRQAPPLHVAQPPYNLIEHQIKQEVLPYTRKYNLTTLTYGTLCRGLLKGKTKPDTQFTGDSLRNIDPKFREPPANIWKP